MIKLKISSQEMQALTRYLQIAIEIARYEINNGSEVVISRFSESTFVKCIPWPKESSTQNVLHIVDRNAKIDEFERLQLKFMNKYDKRNITKKKTMDITKSAGSFFIHYMPKVEHAYYLVNAPKEGMDYINFIAQTQANVILKNLM